MSIHKVSFENCWVCVCLCHFVACGLKTGEENKSTTYVCMYVMTYNQKHEQRNQTFDFPPNLPASHPASQPAKRRTGLFYPRSASLALSRSIWASLALSVRLCLSEALWASLGFSGPLWEHLYVRHLLRRYHGIFPWYVLGLFWLQGMYHCTFPWYLLGLFKLHGMYVPPGSTSMYVRHLLGRGCKVCTTAYFHGMYLLGLFKLQGTPASQPASQQPGA